MSEIDFRQMLPLYGVWEVPGSASLLRFSGGDGSASHGLVLIDRSVDDGLIECCVKLPRPTSNTGAFVVFRASGQERYYGIRRMGRCLHLIGRSPSLSNATSRSGKRLQPCRRSDL